MIDAMAIVRMNASSRSSPNRLLPIASNVPGRFCNRSARMAREEGARALDGIGKSNLWAFCNSLSFFHLGHSAGRIFCSAVTK
jgi:hypothetical protein